MSILVMLLGFSEVNASHETSIVPVYLFYLIFTSVVNCLIWCVSFHNCLSMVCMVYLFFYDRYCVYGLHDAYLLEYLNEITSNTCFFHFLYYSLVSSDPNFFLYNAVTNCLKPGSARSICTLWFDNVCSLCACLY